MGEEKYILYLSKSAKFHGAPRQIYKVLMLLIGLW